MNEKQYNLYNNTIGWLLFLVAAFVYLSTLEPTTSLWDCGEFIAASYKLQIVHPPGNPMFLMINRLFSMLAPTEEWVPILINAQSAISSALAILFLFWIITHFARKITVSKGEQPDTGQLIAIMGSGIVGASAFTFSDTFWFSAVEGETYALSAMLMALVFWLGIKWDNRADQPGNLKYLLLIAYIVGVSIGVHLLSLLIIPLIGFFYYFRKFDRITWKGISITAIVGLVGLGIVQTGVIKTLPWFASQFELLFVNSFGLPFWSGIFFFIALLFAALTWGIYYTFKNNRTIIHNSLVGLTFVLIGFSSYSMVVIRSQADPSIDMNNPETVFNLISYLNREQYGDRPLLYGHYFNAEPQSQKDGDPRYRKGEDKYLELPPRQNLVYDESDKTFFPRMVSRRGDRKSAYRKWATIGQNEDPTFGDNLEFFFKYQIGHMFWRYFAWNYVGRQNDIQGHGRFWRGNWLSGIPFMDINFGNAAKQADLPSFLKGNKARNTFFFLPFLLGLVGLFHHFNQRKWDAFTVLVFFIMTGLMLILYLNQPPREPRERDYSLVGAFYAFSIWIGLGTLKLIEYAKKLTKPKLAGVIATVGALALVPTVMASNNWDDHDRSERYTTIEFAKNHLRSLDSNAVLFAYGDNETYPLWYAQEVEGFRTDVRVINLNLLNARWYVEQLRKDNYLSEGLQFDYLKPDKLSKGQRSFVRYAKHPNIGKKEYVALDKVMKFIASDASQTQRRTRGGDRINYLPAKRVKMDIDKEAVVESGVVPEDMKQHIEDEVRFKLGGGSLMLSDLMILDLIANTEFTRPIYFTAQVPGDSYFKMNKYLLQDGLSYKLVPMTKKTDYRGKGTIDTDSMYNNFVNEFKWGGLPDSSLYLGYVTRRHCGMYRGHFSKLADALIANNQNEKAQKALNTCMNVFPNQQVAFDARVTPLVTAYYDAGAPKQGRAHAGELRQVLTDNLEYLTDLSRQHQREARRKIRNGFYGLNRLRRSASRAGQDTFAREIGQDIQRLQNQSNLRRGPQQRRR